MCNKDGDIDENIKPIDITEELKENGYKLSKGRYKIRLTNEKGNEVMSTSPFKIK